MEKKGYIWAVVAAAGTISILHPGFLEASIGNPSVFLVGITIHQRVPSPLSRLQITTISVVDEAG